MREKPRNYAKLQRQAGFAQSSKLLSELRVTHFDGLLFHHNPIFDPALREGNPVIIQYTNACMGPQWS
ncbi:hypothetical protein KSB_45130 [Ktedonobacter robiniae]|uniref:Uncharacterized protein n=1 Tax=Ktedonobacter robiniae TaxID=2778365 RepID=A0ABQ3UTB6_9CHLR|nr:hypothetical protein KSB_45130 [Ktedonobacter robiniae]